MMITVKLYAFYKKYCPSGAENGMFELNVNTGSTVGDIICQVGIPNDLTVFALVNGKNAISRDMPICDGDKVSLFPPIIGG